MFWTNFNLSKVDGVLLDLGVSSRQLDVADRGFSFQKPGPLDMRMDQNAPVRAADLVNGSSDAELTRIFRLYGEEPAAARVAAAIVKARRQQPIEDTLSSGQGRGNGHSQAWPEESGHAGVPGIAHRGQR